MDMNMDPDRRLTSVFLVEDYLSVQENQTVKGKSRVGHDRHTCNYGSSKWIFRFKPILCKAHRLKSVIQVVQHRPLKCNQFDLISINTKIKSITIGTSALLIMSLLVTIHLPLLVTHAYYGICCIVPILQVLGLQQIYGGIKTLPEWTCFHSITP